MDKKIVFLEGLPAVGKTTIKDEFKNIDGFCAVDEIINSSIFVCDNCTQNDFMENDNMKVLSTSCEKTAIVDRGPISTLAYNYTRHIIDPTFDFDIKEVEQWFSSFENLLQSKSVVVYFLTTNGKDYYLPYENNLDPYGSVENQKLLEAITLFVCKKYCKNLVVKEYHKFNDMGELISEIINKFVCS